MSVSPRQLASCPHKGWHNRGYLPHFDGDAVVQMITFRLADSIPRAIFDSLLAAAKTDEERHKQIERLIDRGRGACILRRERIAKVVNNALRHFDGERYRLLAWVIMPNHAHVLIEQLAGYPLSSVVHSWKSFTAKEINKLERSSGTVWAPDYHDRFVRNAEHYENAVHYIEQNPVKAGLARQAEDWLFSSASARMG
jgi:REP element-mobilizing transposase RayT